MNLGIRSSISVLNDIFRGYRRHVFILVVLGFAGAALDGIGINAVVPLLSFLMGSEAPADFISRAIMWLFSLVGVPFTFRYLLAFIIILFLLRAVALAASAYVRGYINAHYMTREMSELLRATMKSEWQFMARQKSGYVQNTIFWDVKHTAELLDRVVQFVQSCAASFIYLIVALNISVPVTLMTFLFGTIMLLTLRRPLISRVRVFGALTSGTEKSISQHIIEYLHGFKQIKTADAAEGAIGQVGADFAQLREAHGKTVFLQGLSGVLLQPVAFLFIIGLFAFSYGTHTLNLAAFAATLYLIQKIFSSLDSTQSIFVAGVQLMPFAENLSAYRRIVKSHREDDGIDGVPFSLEKEVELRDVSFSYANGVAALSRVSARIPKGAMVGVIGASGGGKTSLADLLLRLFEPTKGEILIDGVRADGIRLADWRARVAYVSQDAFLMNASIEDNIRFFDSDITGADIERAAKDAHVYEEIMRLPQGFATVIGDRGVMLSGGQRQRVALARALARRPQVLVLDEVTSALDSELERQIKEVIEGLHGQVTLIIIAHRVSTVLGADSILVLDKGSVAALGSPQSMLSDPDSYLSRMLAMQGRREEPRA